MPRYTCDHEVEFCDCEMIHEDTVRKVKENMLDKESFKELSGLYKAFADGTRVSILYALEQHEMCVCDIAALLGMTKSAVSHQLKTLRMADLVRSRREGQVVYYSIADDHVKLILNMGLEHINE